ncbi:MAG: hypothetical protein ACKVE3_08370 [Dissulfuribacterales bacterium]
MKTIFARIAILQDRMRWINPSQYFSGDESEMTTQYKLYDNIYEYVQNADISYYRLSTSVNNGEEIIITGFYPVDDPDFSIEPDNAFEMDGKIYIPVCFGEDEPSALLEDALTELCYIRYIYNPYIREYVSDGIVYETQEQAEKFA